MNWRRADRWTRSCESRSGGGVSGAAFYLLRLQRTLALDTAGVRRIHFCRYPMSAPRYTYPHTIENGAGERLTFLRRVPGTQGERLEVENVVQPGAGPPMHIHRHQIEALTVQSGRIAYQRPGREPQYAGPGETVAFGAGEPHRFWNAGEGELRCTGYIEPPDNIEYFLTELYASTARNGGHRPDPFDAAFLVHHYRSEFTLLAVPYWVQRVVFPLQVALGRLLGKYSRYADAPQPVAG